MSLGENGGNEMVMPVAPMYGGGYGNSGFGCGDGWWVILFLFALMGNGGWGNGFGGGSNGLFPYFTATNTDAGVQRGFDTAALTNQLSGINTSLTNGFANAEVAGCNRAMDDYSQDSYRRMETSRDMGSYMSGYNRGYSEARRGRDGDGDGRYNEAASYGYNTDYGYSGHDPKEHMIMEMQKMMQKLEPRDQQVVQDCISRIK